MIDSDVNNLGQINKTGRYVWKIDAVFVIFGRFGARDAVGEGVFG